MFLWLTLVIDGLASCRISTANRVSSIDQSALAHVKTLWLPIYANLLAAILAHESVRIDLLLDLLLFLLALKVLSQAHGLLVHEARPDARLNRLHGSISTVVALIVNATIHICWLIEVHACGVRVRRVEGVCWQRLLRLLLQLRLTKVRWLMR